MSRRIVVEALVVVLPAALRRAPGARALVAARREAGARREPRAPLCRRPGRARRPAAPGAGARADDRALPARAAGAYAAEPLGRRVVRAARSRPGQDDPTGDPPASSRRPAAAAAHPAPPLRGADARPVPAARRVDRRGLAGGARRRRGRGLPRRRAGAVPIASGLPVVVTLLDLAPWELPERTSGRPAATVRPALRASSCATPPRSSSAPRPPPRARDAAPPRPPDRIRVVPLAPRPRPRRLGARRAPEATAAPRRPWPPTASGSACPSATRLLGPVRRPAGPGTLLGALGRLAAAGARPRLRSGALAARVLLVEATPRRPRCARPRRRASRCRRPPRLRAGPATRAARADSWRGSGRDPPGRDRGGRPAGMEALAAGTPVVASAVGALPEIVGSAGLLVEPGDPRRLAAALGAIWTDDAIHAAASGGRWSAPGRAAHLGGRGSRDARGLRGRRSRSVGRRDGKAATALRRAAPRRAAADRRGRRRRRHRTVVERHDRAHAA